VVIHAVIPGIEVMKAEILFASHNSHKVDEVRKLLPDGFTLIGLRDINWTEEIPEPFFSYEENAKAKAYFIYDRTGISCFADDSGLEIDALEGRPGVFSARYAGPQRNHSDNIQKVLMELQGKENRQARFQSAIAYITSQNKIEVFKGTVEGTITHAPKGNGGFGYDPVFIPSGFDQTFGELSDTIKNSFSHRAKAMQKFIEYLRVTK